VVVGASPVEDAAGRAATAVLNPLELPQTARDQDRRTPNTFTSVTCAETLFRGTVSRVTKYPQIDEVGWDRGREGYLDLPQKPVYAAVAKPDQKCKGQEPLLTISTEVRLASLITAGGMIWGAYAATVHFTGVVSMDLIPPGPIEVCALGILIWLHAKWRHSTKVN